MGEKERQALWFKSDKAVSVVETGVQFQPLDMTPHYEDRVEGFRDTPFVVRMHEGNLESSDAQPTSWQDSLLDSVPRSGRRPRATPHETPGRWEGWARSRRVTFIPRSNPYST